MNKSIKQETLKMIDNLKEKIKQEIKNNEEALENPLKVFRVSQRRQLENEQINSQT